MNVWAATITMLEFESNGLMPLKAPEKLLEFHSLYSRRPSSYYEAALKMRRLGPLLFSVFLASLMVLLSHNASGAMTELQDEELSGVVGQALMQTNKVVGGGGVTFYTAGLDAVLELNMNIEKLQLGCTNAAVNGQRCDIDADRFSLGCIANGSNQCVSLNPTGIEVPGAVSDIAANRQRMRDMVITRPYFQFAVKNDGSRTLREVVGIRLGGENVSGPMSIGNLNTFSGYMTATANMTMQGQTDIAAVCGPANPGCSEPNVYGYNAPDRSLGLSNFEACAYGICEDANQLTVNYSSASLNNIPVLANGKRLTQAIIQDVNLGAPVGQIVDSMTVNRSNGLPSWAINLLIGQVRAASEPFIREQLADGLKIGTPQQLPGCASIDNCDMPYNLKNVHQIEVNSSNFGFSFQRESVQYPGYAVPMTTGWTMYLPDAFTLNVSRPATVFTYSILQGNAYNGDIIGLEPPYRNCWGTASFC